MCGGWVRYEGVVYSETGVVDENEKMVEWLLSAVYLMMSTLKDPSSVACS